MVPAAPKPEPRRRDARSVRRRRVPERQFGDRVIVARPADGAPVVLAAPAAFVWRALDDWISVKDLEDRVAASFPEVSPDEQRTGCSQIIEQLEADDLVERR